MNLIRKNKQFFLFVGVYFLSLVGYSQDRSIYIEDLGPADGAVTPVWIPRDTSKIDFENIRNKMPSYIGTFGLRYSNPNDFDLLECILKNELENDTINKGRIEWSNIRIVFFDESFNVTYERYICCGRETEKRFKRLLKLKSVSSNQFITELFLNYISYDERINNRK